MGTPVSFHLRKIELEFFSVGRTQRREMSKGELTADSVRD
jgi:hypothetical protein